MTPRRRSALVLALVFSATGASHRTTNFVVHAPTPEIAERVGQWAEYYRKHKALEWLGHEMPNWPAPCPLHVRVTLGGPGGATHFNFGASGVTSQMMEINGPLDRLIYSVLPHEITHTVFAFHFRRPVPRWADEGGSVLSEDAAELESHNKMVRTFMSEGRQFPLRRLFSLEKYPQENGPLMCLYAQGFSVSHYLVYRSDKQTFLKFVAHGMRQGWDSAAQAYYGHRNVEELEQSWNQHMVATREHTIAQLAQLKSRPQGQPAAQMVVRTTAPPAQPLQPAPVYRGAAPNPNEQGQRFGDVRPTAASGPRPGYLPDAPGALPSTPWPQVQLGPIQYDPPPGSAMSGPVPALGIPR